ncbi:hypothetical protein DAMA08_004460 [Martiniozyma asiatica (nom. inval.)]|nr:hypothetical protein DAMA08_004460 [Martiniozyma asiatica]
MSQTDFPLPLNILKAGPLNNPISSFLPNSSLSSPTFSNSTMPNNQSTVFTMSNSNPITNPNSMNELNATNINQKSSQNSCYSQSQNYFATEPLTKYILPKLEMSQPTSNAVDFPSFNLKEKEKEKLSKEISGRDPSEIKSNLANVYTADNQGQSTSAENLHQEIYNRQYKSPNTGQYKSPKTRKSNRKKHKSGNYIEKSNYKSKGHKEGHKEKKKRAILIDDISPSTLFKLLELVEPRSPQIEPNSIETKKLFTKTVLVDFLEEEKDNALQNIDNYLKMKLKDEKFKILVSIRF